MKTPVSMRHAVALQQSEHKEMRMKMTFTNPALSVGKYKRCTFVGVQRIQTTFGDRAQWEFEDPQSGKRASSFSTPEATLRNKCGQNLAALAGIEVEEGKTVDPADFIGQLYDIEVVQSEKGTGTVVQSFTPSDDTPF